MTLPLPCLPALRLAVAAMAAALIAIAWGV